jgi:hypothetical protein
VAGRPITEQMLNPQGAGLTAEVVVTASLSASRADQSDHRQTSQGVGTLKRPDRSPPYAEFFCTVVYIPAQKIFAKVKAAI